MSISFLFLPIVTGGKKWFVKNKHKSQMLSSYDQSIPKLKTGFHIQGFFYAFGVTRDIFAYYVSCKQVKHLSD